MKIGKQPKRFGVPSDKFLSKTRPEILTVPLEGPVRLYIDKSRACPECWTAVRKPEDFFTIMNSDSSVLNRITHLSFDNFFGLDEIDGFQIINRLADYFTQEEDFLPLLKAIGLHTINRSAAVLMDRLLADALSERRKRIIYVQWGTPRLDMSEIPKGLNNAKPPVRYIDRTHRSTETGGS